MTYTSVKSNQSSTSAKPVKATPDLVKMLRDEVIPRLRPEQVYRFEDHKFQHSSDRLRGIPPWGESTSGTSFAVFPDTLRFLDAHNGESGDAVKYLHSRKVNRYEQPKGQDWIDTAKVLFQMASMDFPEREWTPAQIKKAHRRESRELILKAVKRICFDTLWSKRGEAARKHLIEERGFNEKGLKDFGIGLYPSVAEVRKYLEDNQLDIDLAYDIGVLTRKWEEYMIFPWAGSQGNPLTLYGHQTKAWEKATGKPKKYALWNPKDGNKPWLHTKESPYLLHRTIRDHHKKLVLVEGIIDAAIAHQEGDTSVVACVSSTLSKEQVKTLADRKIEQLTIALDPDEAGDKGIDSCIKSLSKVGISTYIAPKLPEGLDPDDFIRKYGIKVWKEHISKSEHAYTWKAEQIIARGNLTTDQGKEAVLNEAKQFARTVKDNPNLDLFFWSVIAKALEMDLESFIRKLEEEIHQAVDERSTQKQQEGVSKNNEPDDEISAAEFALQMVELYRDTLAWHAHFKEWYTYVEKDSPEAEDGKQEGIWHKIPESVAAKKIIPIAHLVRGKFGSPFIDSTMKLLKSHLGIEKWDETEGLLPLKNGVLNLATKELTPHFPGNRFTWYCPYSYDPLATCDPIQEWLLETVDGDADLVQLIRGYLNAIVKGRTDLQRYLELIGPGGTGKSTLMRLAEALIGSLNTHSTTLKKLEESRFETASILGKRLVVVTDAERYSGGISTLKALTGQDRLPYEVKFKQSAGGFTPNAMVIVAANEMVQTGDYTSGLERRRLTVPFLKQIQPDKQRNLIELRNGELEGEFVEYIPGLLNWVLAMPDAEVKNFVKNTTTYVPSLSHKKAESLVEANPIAAWVDDCLVHRKGTRTYVGIAKRDKDPDSENSYQNVQTWLYASYCEYSLATGTKPVGLQRFVNLLKDLFQNQLRLDINREKDRVGSYFTNLKIRAEYDQEPPIITGNHKPGSPPPKPPSPKPKSPSPNSHTSKSSPSPSNSPSSQSSSSSLACDGCVMDDAMDESLTSDECDGCDGLFEKPVVLGENVEGKVADAMDDDEPVDIGGETFAQSPSHPSQVNTDKGLNHHRIHHKSITHPSQTSTDKKEEQTVEVANPPRQMDLADVEVKPVAQSTLQVAKQQEASQKDIEDIAKMLKDAKNGNMVMLVLELFCNQSPEVKLKIWDKIEADKKKQILAMRSEAQDTVQPGDKCKVRLARKNNLWVDGNFIAWNQDQENQEWTFQVEDGCQETVFVRGDWLLVELDKAPEDAECAEFAETAESAENAEIAEFAEISSPWDESEENDSLTAEQKKMEAMVQAATEKFQS